MATLTIELDQYEAEIVLLAFKIMTSVMDELKPHNRKESVERTDMLLKIVNITAKIGNEARRIKDANREANQENKMVHDSGREEGDLPAGFPDSPEVRRVVFGKETDKSQG